MVESHGPKACCGVWICQALDGVILLLVFAACALFGLSVCTC